MNRRLFHVDLGAAGPHHDETVAPVPLFESADVGNDLLREVTLVFPLLDVRALKPLDVPLIEHGGHRADGFKLSPDAIELGRFEHACRPRGRVTVFLEDVPAAKNDVVEISERDELVDLRRAPFAPLPEADRPHLRQRSNRRRESFPDGKDAGDGRRRNRAQPDEEDAKLAARGSNLSW